MRLASSFIVMNLALVSVSPAFAGAKEDALTLHKAVVSGMMTYIELGESSDGRSRELGVAMEEKVTTPSHVLSLTGDKPQTRMQAPLSIRHS